MKAIIIIALLFPILVSGQTKPAERIPISFEALVKNINTINFPYSHDCGADFKIVSNNEVDNALRKYLPKGFLVFGKVTDNEKYTAMILVNTTADYAVPYLTTFNKQGKIIAKFELYKIGCSIDEFYEGHAKFTIDKNLRIYMNDTSASYKRDNAGQIIKQSIITKSNKYVFNILADGTIENVKSKDRK